MTGKEMWENYCKISKCDVNIPYEEFKFCGGGELGDQLANFVLSKEKSATSSLYILYEHENEPLPKIGYYSIVLFDNDEAACIIQNTKVSIVPFKDVSEEHAHMEGEGDKSLKYWREVHKDVFSSELIQIGIEFNDNLECVLEEFKLIYPQK